MKFNFISKFMQYLARRKNHREFIEYLRENENAVQLGKIMQNAYAIEADERISNMTLYSINNSLQSEMSFAQAPASQDNGSSQVRTHSFTNIGGNYGPPSGGMQNAYANIGNVLGIMGADSMLAPYYVYMTYWTTFYQTSSLAKRLVDILTMAMCSKWVTYTTDKGPASEDNIKKMKNFVKKHRMRAHNTRGTRQMFMHGGCAIYIDTSDPDLKEPLNEDILHNTFLGFKFVDQGLLVPADFRNTFNFGANHFNSPAMWQIVYPNGTKSLQIHRSRFIFYIPDELPFDAKINQLWWGTSIFVAVHDDINNAERSFKSSGQSMQQASVKFLKTDMKNRTRVPGAAQNMQNKNYLFQKAITQNGNAILLDKEDEIEKLEIGNFKSQTELLIALVNKICASPGIPLTMYWGNPQTGFSSGDAEIIHFQGTVSFSQENYLQDPLGQMFRIANMVLFKKPDVVEFEFNPIYESTESQKADVSLKKSQRRAIDKLTGVPTEVILEETARDGVYPDLQYADCAKYAKEADAKEAAMNAPKGPGFEAKDVKDDKETNKKPTNANKSNQPENIVQKSVYK